MPIPTARTIVQEILQQVADGREHDLSKLRHYLVSVFHITVDEMNERLPSGRETVLANRIRNAVFMIRKDQLAVFADPKNAIQITEKGQAYLSSHGKALKTFTTRMTPTDKVREFNL